MLKGNCLKTMVAESGSNSAIGLCKMTPNSRYLMFANLNNRIGIYNFQNELVKQYLGHKNQESLIEGMFVKDRHTGKMKVVYGGEDGKITGWDMNSQDVIFRSQVEPKLEGKSMLISTLDYDQKYDLIVASGNFKGFYINKMSNL